MMSSQPFEYELDDGLGVFPMAGPVPYLTDDAGEARVLLAGPAPVVTAVWFHATSAEVADVAVRHGLIPSCWRGGDGCVVFGSASADDVSIARTPVLVEVESRALAGQLRAWWVPWQRIRGAWIHGRFIAAHQLRERPVALVDEVRSCACPLSALVAEQQTLWRRTKAP